MMRLALSFFSESDENDGVVMALRVALANKDIELAENIVENNEDDDISEVAFRIAVQEGCYEYVDAHCDDVELNDGDDGNSTYIYETDDEDMIELLMDAGAYRSFEDYEDYVFAVETVNGTVLAFKPEFKRIVFNKLLKVMEMTEEQVVNALESGNAEEIELPDEISEFDLTTLAEACENLLVSTDEGELLFEDFDFMDDSVQGWTVQALVEGLGYDTSFQGTRNRHETVGVYCIKDMPADEE